MLDCELGMVHKWFAFTSHKILEGSCVVPHFGGLTSEFCCCSMWTSKVSRLKKQGINQHTHTPNTKRKGLQSTCKLVHIWEFRCIYSPESFVAILFIHQKNSTTSSTPHQQKADNPWLPGIGRNARNNR